MFNIKLEKKSYKMSFKALTVKRQRSKNLPPTGTERVKVVLFRVLYLEVKRLDLLIVALTLSVK